MKRIRLTDFSTRLAPILAALALAAAPATAQDKEKQEEKDSETPEFYQLSIRDQVQLSVYGEPDLKVDQRIDGKGQIRVPLLGTVKISGMTVRDAEEFIQNSYIDNRLLRHPMVTIRVADYAAKEVSVFGAVVSPGKLEFPIEAGKLSIVDVIAAMGGFTGIAKSNAVQVTRSDSSGQKNEFKVDVESMITDRKRKKKTDDVEIIPGDVIFVPERIF